MGTETTRVRERELDRDWSRQVVDAIHPELDRLRRWALAVACGATFGAILALMVGVLVTEPRLGAAEITRLAVFVGAGLVALWVFALFAARTVAAVREHLIGIVGTESALRGRAAALVLATELRPGAATQERALPRQRAASWVAAKAGANANRNGERRRRERVGPADSAGRYALSALVALSSLGTSTAAPADERVGEGRHVV